VATPAIQSQIEAAAAGLGLKTMRLRSGAGVSHSPKELTRWPDCANGANVLLQTVLRMDRS